MNDARMDLRGWEHTILNEDDNKNIVSTVLGIKWNKKMDTLSVNIDSILPIINNITKRNILAKIYQLYDPIGVLSPITVFAKILLQEIWSMKISWDDPVPEDVKERFATWVCELKYLKQIEIPRCIFRESYQNLSMHTFCDASKVAYATVIFLRLETNSEVFVQFVQAKTRIVPLKPATIPRLELLAATIGARLAKDVYNTLNNDQIEKYFWSDSTTVLAWIQREDVWGTFVNNRVREIRQLSTTKCWYYITGKLTPADLPSGGCNSRQLTASRWWEAPDWLKRHPVDWPKLKPQHEEEEVNKERKKIALSLLVSTGEENWYYRRFSKYQTVVNVQAWILRFLQNCQKNKQNGQFGELSIEEIDNAEYQIMKLIQREENYFQEKKFHPLRIIQDKEGICRVKTKIINREDTTHFRLPVALPPHHEVVKMLIHKYHLEMGHCGSLILLNKLRERFWIIQARKAIRSVLKKCVICRRYESKSMEAEASALPKDRVRNAFIFEICGVDFADPLHMKNGTKAWVCLFTCAIYRAVHLELTTSLSIESFTLVLRRFIARRGRPRTIFSDNATNFRGTQNLLGNVNWDELRNYTRVQHIEWRFNPPGAPWWGGWWERLIRLLKNLLKRILQRSSLKYEEMSTILCDCEAIVNSLPLTYMFDSETEVTPITLAMFLQEVDEIGVPDLDAIDKTNLSRRLRYRQKLREDLRARFRSEYVGQLVHQTSISREHRKIMVGDIVLIGNDSTKRVDWPMVRVIKLIPGKDGVVRVVHLRSKNCEFIRPIQRIFPLEIDSSEDRKILSDTIRGKRRRPKNKILCPIIKQKNLLI